jgi:tetratricopeptide (TPR) repeat protein
VIDPPSPENIGDSRNLEGDGVAEPPPDANLGWEQRMEIMKREIDTLQIQAATSSRPWYQNVSALLSIIALLFSFGTTYVSYRRTTVQDIQNARQELRGLLQRLAALPKENVEAGKKYADDPASRNMVGGFINQENTLLARNAAELAKKLPATAVSATEYYAIAGALQSAYDLAAANEFLEHAIKANPDFNTEISALRMAAGMKFLQGRPEDGRVEYQRALAIFSKYPQYDPFTKASTNVLTELSWAFSEANNNALSLATEHVENAEKFIVPLPGGVGVNMLKSQIAQARSQIVSGKPPESITPIPQMTVVPTTPK